MRWAHAAGRIQGDSVVVEWPATASPAIRGPSTYGLVAHGAEALLLFNERLKVRGYFAGDLSTLSLGELFGHLVGGVRSGELIVTRGPFRKSVVLKDGQVVFASSTEPFERLGRSLVRRKLLTQDKLEKALGQVRPGVKLGQILTREKWLSPSVLYSAMTELVKEILLGLFELAEGDFVFFEGRVAPEDALKLPERTRDLVLEGLKRSEEVLRLRQRHASLRNVRRGKAQASKELHTWVGYATAGCEVSVLRAHFEGGEYAFWVTLESLLQAGVLVPEAPAAQPSAGLTQAVSEQAAAPAEMYASLIRTICTGLRKAGKDLADLHSFFEDPLPGLEKAFAGVHLSEEGALNVDRVLANFGPSPLARAQAYEALDAFVSYALFSAKNVLPGELAQLLGDEFRNIREGLEG